jgi:hypothetical protein
MAVRKAHNKQKRRRGPSKFKIADAQRVVRATLATGLPISRVEVDPASGRVSVVIGQPAAASGNELDQWVAKRANKDAHPA